MEEINKEEQVVVTENSENSETVVENKKSNFKKRKPNH